jgi:hypothetical protein
VSLVLGWDTSPEMTCARLTEVRRRVAQIESGEAALIPGDEVLARVQNLLADSNPSGNLSSIKLGK